MGFGLLFIGYFMATVMSLNTLGGVFSAIGFLIMLLGAKKLMQYNQSFLLLLCACVAMSLFSSVIAVGEVSTLLSNLMIIGAPIVSEAVTTLLRDIRTVLDLIFVAFMCICVRNIAKETGADKIEYAAIRNIVFFCIYFIIQLVVWLSATLQTPWMLDFVNGTALPIWALLVYILCQLLLCFMLFSCYSKICDINDTEMRQKPSRFAFINRRRAISEARHKQYMEEAEKYSEEQKRCSAAENKKRKRRK